MNNNLMGAQTYRKDSEWNAIHRMLIQARHIRQSSLAEWIENFDFGHTKNMIGPPVLSCSPVLFCYFNSINIVILTFLAVYLKIAEQEGRMSHKSMRET